MKYPTFVFIAAAIGTGLLIAQTPEQKPEPAGEGTPPPPGERREGEPRRGDNPQRPEEFRPGDDRRPGGPDRPQRRPDGSGGERPFRPDGEPGERVPQRGPQDFPDGERPPRPQGPRPGGMMNQPVPLKLQPYLGVITRMAPPELNMQLKLPEGFGLIVDDVVGDGPAKAAGIQSGDLLRMLDDQWLANTPQLESLVRRAGKDKEVSLTLMREGSEQKVTVKIGEKMLPIRRPIPMMSGMPNDGRDPFAQGNGGQGPDGTRQPFRDDRNQPGADRQIRYATDRARVVRRDDSGTYEIARVNGTRIFTARKPDGSIAWKGPVDSEEDRKAMPAEVLKKFEEIEKSRPLDRLPGPRPGEQPSEPEQRREPRPQSPPPPPAPRGVDP